MKFMKLGSKPDYFQTDDNEVRFVATELASDITISVGDVKFYLHKFPLLSKSSLLQRLVALGNEDDDDEICISDIPGGAAAFEICAKFCYGMAVTLNAYNVVAARCAAQYLEMLETVEKGNLIYKIDVFLSSSVLRGWKDSIIVLQTAKSFLPWAEDLRLIAQCIDSIAAKICLDPSKVEWSYSYCKGKIAAESARKPHVPRDWWVEDLCELDVDSFKRVIGVVKSKGRVSGDVIGEALKAYTYRRVAGFGKGAVQAKSRGLVETVSWMLPAEKSAVSCSFLFKLLRASRQLECGQMCVEELVKRAGRQLPEASAVELLMLRQRENDQVFDVDLVMSIVSEFLNQEHDGEPELGETKKKTESAQRPSILAVANLIDCYLVEVAGDPKLPLSKFVDLAEIIPGHSRPVHDGLYRAVDVYLKEHAGMTKSEKRKVCGVIDCGKLSADACVHAVQNERLPLRVVVQVLFFEQVRAAGGGGGAVPLPAAIRSLLPGENCGSQSSSMSGATTNTVDEDWDAEEIKAIRPVRLGNESSRRISSGSGDTQKSSASQRYDAGQSIPKAKGILGKLLAGKQHGRDNSGSDTSGSPASAKQGHKLTPTRNGRYSVS
ncbi:phototropic-responsive NPH3 family protein NPY4-like [Wolffia australiana]